MFAGTIAAGLLWVGIGSYFIVAVEYLIDSVAGWINGITPEEVKELREWDAS